MNAVAPVRQSFRPNSWAQQRCLLSPAPQMLYSGRYGSSKSRTLCEKADLYCRLYPGARVIIARKKRAHLGGTTLPILLEETITSSERGRGWYPAADGGSTLRYDNGSEILCAGLDNPGRLRSGQYGLALVDQAEELDEIEWNAILGRMRHRVGPYQQVAGFCNPESPAHFLWRRFRPDRGSHLVRSRTATTLLSGEQAPAGTMLRETILAGATDNVENLTPAYQLTLESYTGAYYERYVLGKWVAYEGLVFPNYSPDVHLVSRPSEWDVWGGFPPPEWPRWAGIDLGYTNPFSVQWLAEDPEGNIWRYREIYMSGRTIDRHASDIIRFERFELETLRASAKRRGKAFERQYESSLRYLNMGARYCDHDRGEREMLHAAGVATEAADKDRSAGRLTLVRCFGKGTAQSPGRLRLVRNALVEMDPMRHQLGRTTCLADELPLNRYKNPQSSLENGTDERIEETVDRDAHAIDALRYGVHSRAAATVVAAY